MTTVSECKLHPGEWLVETIVGDGAVQMVRFSGSDANTRAHMYVAQMYVGPETKRREMAPAIQHRYEQMEILCHAIEDKLLAVKELDEEDCGRLLRMAQFVLGLPEKAALSPDAAKGGDDA